MAQPSIPTWFHRFALVQACIAISGVTIWFLVRTEALLAGPPSPDLYANNWGFQLVVFALVWLPLASIATISILVAEVIVLVVLRGARRSFNAP